MDCNNSSSNNNSRNRAVCSSDLNKSRVEMNRDQTFSHDNDVDMIKSAATISLHDGCDLKFDACLQELDQCFENALNCSSNGLSLEEAQALHRKVKELVKLRSLMLESSSSSNNNMINEEYTSSAALCHDRRNSGASQRSKFSLNKREESMMELPCEDEPILSPVLFPQIVQSEDRFCSSPHLIRGVTVVTTPVKEQQITDVTTTTLSQSLPCLPNHFPSRNDVNRKSLTAPRQPQRSNSQKRNSSCSLMLPDDRLLLSFPANGICNGNQQDQTTGSNSNTSDLKKPRRSHSPVPLDQALPVVTSVPNFATFYSSTSSYNARPGLGKTRTDSQLRLPVRVEEKAVLADGSVPIMSKYNGDDVNGTITTLQLDRLKKMVINENEPTMPLERLSDKIPSRDYVLCVNEDQSKGGDNDSCSTPTDVHVTLNNKIKKSLPSKYVRRKSEAKPEEIDLDRTGHSFATGESREKYANEEVKFVNLVDKDATSSRPTISPRYSDLSEISDLSSSVDSDYMWHKTYQATLTSIKAGSKDKSQRRSTFTTPPSAHYDDRRRHRHSWHEVAAK